MARAQARPIHQRWLSVERLSDAAFIALLTVLEVAPIQAALSVYAVTQAGSLADTFGPLWLLAVVLLLFALARWWLGRSGPVWLTIVSLLLGLAALGLFARFSPTAYGDAPGGLLAARWLDQLQIDAAYNTSRFNDLFSILPFTVYLGWRGLTLGGPLPRIGVTLRRYTFSLAVVMLACVGALAAPNAQQPALQSMLLKLLALDVFAGLAVAALARRGDGRESSQGTTSAETTRWLLTALGAAALVVLVAFVLGLALNLHLAHALHVAFSPVGAAVNVALAWLTTSIAYLLWIIFVKTIGALFFKHPAFYLTQPHSGSPLPSKTPKQVLAPPPHALIVAAGVIVALLVITAIIVAVYIAVRAVLRVIHPIAEPEVDEDREALDARGLLRRQARDFLAGLWRRNGDESDPLPAGSARWLYRETLRAGAAAGVARRDGETADEYSQRLTRFAQERDVSVDDGGLAELTHVYDDARYGDRTAAPPRDVVAAARRATAAIARLRANR